MAARAIVGILLGILAVPILWLMMVSSQFPLMETANPALWSWMTSITTDFNLFLNTYIASGIGALQLPLITLFSPAITISQWLSWFAAAMIVWLIIGMWAGAIERSPGRAIGVAVGVWLGWLIIEIIWLAMMGGLGLILAAILDQWFALVIAIIAAAVVGAMCKSEEF